MAPRARRSTCTSRCAALGNPPLPYNHPTTLDGIRFLVTGEQFRGQFSGLFTTSSVGPFLSSFGELAALAGSRATPVFPIVGLVGLGLLVLRRPAFGLACWAALIAGIDVWANYLHLEHYLLVPWLLLGIGVAVALDTAATLVTRAIARMSAGDGAARVVVLGTAAVGAALAVALVVVNLPTVDRHDDSSGQAYADAMMTKLPPNAAIFSYWASTTPLWYARFVEDMRPDVLIVDDTNIVYEGWQSRERRIATLICDRPVYVMRPFDKELDPTRAQYDLTEAFQVRVGLGTPDAVETVPVYRVDARPGQCP